MASETKGDMPADRSGQGSTGMKRFPSTHDVLVFRQPKPALATPNAHDPDGARVTPIDDPERWMDEFPQRTLTKFRDHTPHAGMVRQVLDAPHDVANQPGANIPHTLVGIPGSDAFKITKCGLGESNLRGHALFKSETGLGLE